MVHVLDLVEMEKEKMLQCLCVHVPHITRVISYTDTPSWVVGRTVD